MALHEVGVLRVEVSAVLLKAVSVLRELYRLSVLRRRRLAIPCEVQRLGDLRGGEHRLGRRALGCDDEEDEGGVYSLKDG